LFADDATGFAAAVLDLLADPQRAAGLGMAARAKAQTLYDWGTIGGHLLSTYDEVLAEVPRRQAPAKLSFAL
jgi:glycosyltransferase involved in cell wall biosynthesis